MRGFEKSKEAIADLKSFAAAKEFIESGKFTGSFMTISTWNEWTEGNYMEPDTLYGYGYLEAFKEVFKD